MASNVEANESDADAGRLKKGLTSVHVTTLDEVVSVNSFFTAAVFIGLSLVVPTTSVKNSLLLPAPANGACLPDSSSVKSLFVYMVVSFSLFLYSSLIAHAMKLAVLLKNSENRSEAHFGDVSLRTLRLSMVASAIGSVTGTIFLTLALLNIIQLRFGKLGCDVPWSDRWAEKAAIPLLILVPAGLITFVAAVFHSVFFH
eukprot:TRINITY_DN736_c0_g1_i2.p1 TRINITY_DN736_c0_g1~~TRINITY_DN736_c0_g1_i2.p1  ORF type:complete len:200 (+),score=20.20 TRINITY_DN736_c0_g1_i2:146-745(+)